MQFVVDGLSARISITVGSTLHSCASITFHFVPTLSGSTLFRDCVFSECLARCSRLCVDALHSLMLAAKSEREQSVNPAGGNQLLSAQTR